LKQRIQENKKTLHETDIKAEDLDAALQEAMTSPTLAAFKAFA
jgi:hypothetical protein